MTFKQIKQQLTKERMKHIAEYVGKRWDGHPRTLSRITQRALWSAGIPSDALHGNTVEALMQHIDKKTGIDVAAYN